MIVFLGITGSVIPGLAETWDCGESVAYSGNFAIETDPTPCGGDTAVSGLLAIETDLSDCGTGTGAIDQPIIIDTVWSPGSIKKHPLGQTVTLLPLPINRAFAERFYVEALDRSSGIGVVQGITAAPGRLAVVTGTLTNLEGEIVLASPSVSLGDLGECPAPLSMPSSALKLGVGTDPTGLLAMVWGKAVSVPEGEAWYIVSDGGEPVYVLPEGVERPGEGEFVILTGVPGVAEVNGVQVRVLRIKEPYITP